MGPVDGDAGNMHDFALACTAGTRCRGRTRRMYTGVFPFNKQHAFSDSWSLDLPSKMVSGLALKNGRWTSPQGATRIP